MRPGGTGRIFYERLVILDSTALFSVFTGSHFVSFFEIIIELRKGRITNRHSDIQYFHIRITQKTFGVMQLMLSQIIVWGRIQIFFEKTMKLHSGII